MYEIKSGRIKPKCESTFGKAKKPFKGKNRNRKGSKKDSMFNHDRIKPKPSMKNNNEISAEDQSYLEWLTNEAIYPCFVCGCFNGIEWHHVKEFSTDNKNHTRLIPLCGAEHHRFGTELSPHGTPKKWRETYSLKVQLEHAAKIHEYYLAQKS